MNCAHSACSAWRAPRAQRSACAALRVRSATRAACHVRVNVRMRMRGRAGSRARRMRLVNGVCALTHGLIHIGVEDMTLFH